MKHTSPSIEKRVIRSLITNKRSSAFLLSSLNEDYFNWGPCKHFYKRISTLTKKRGHLPSWEELLADPTISEKAREEFKNYKKKPVLSTKRAKYLLNTLDSYRKARHVGFAAIETLKALKESSFDIDKEIERLTESITKAKTRSNKEDQLFELGINDNTDALLKKILKGEAISFIPTGIQAFDSINVGLPRTGLAILAATSSGGKSLLAQQLKRNMSLWGADVCLVPLEMDEYEVMQREISAVCNVSMSKVIDPKKFSDSEIKKIYSDFKSYKKELRRKKVRSTFYVPDEDVNIEEILFLLKPYKYDVIIIDYISLLRGVDGDDQWQKLGAAARFGKIYAKNNNCLVILCAQLSEQGVIRYSRALKEHATNMFSWVFDDAAKETGIIEIDQPKARNQKQFKFYVNMDREHMMIKDLNKEELEYTKQRESNSKNSNSNGSNQHVDKSKFKNKKKKGFAEDDYLEV